MLINDLVVVGMDDLPQVGGKMHPPEKVFAQFFLKLGINSISVTPDSLASTVKAIHKVEFKAMAVE